MWQLFRHNFVAMYTYNLEGRTWQLQSSSNYVGEVGTFQIFQVNVLRVSLLQKESDISTLPMQLSSFRYTMYI